VLVVAHKALQAVLGEEQAFILVEKRIHQVVVILEVAVLVTVVTVIHVMDVVGVEEAIVVELQA
jgi:hypothetical protein